MRINPIIYAVAMLFLVASCASETENKHLGKISQLTCEATDLRNARFALADSMRRIQDSLLESDNTASHKIQEWETKLGYMEERKARLAVESRDLADSIRVELSKLTKEMSLEEKRTFNENLKNIDCKAL